MGLTSRTLNSWILQNSFIVIREYKVSSLHRPYVMKRQYPSLVVVIGRPD